MTRTSILACLLGTAVLASGCTNPRGAVFSREIVSDRQAEKSRYDLVRVSRANLGPILHWPATGDGRPGGWIAPGGQAGGDPQIRPGDRLDLVLWDSEESSLLAGGEQRAVPMSGLKVSPSGEIFLPYVGQIRVAGLEPEAARAQIQEAMIRIAPAAQVQLKLSEGRQNAVDVVGGVGRPGNYPLTDRATTLLGVIAAAGGIPPDMNNPVVRLMRGGRTYEVFAERLLADGRIDPVLRGGDKIVVEPDRRSFTAIGATGTERLQTFPQPDLTAMEALSLIGGLSEQRANAKGVLVLRDYPASALRADGSGPAQPQVVFAFDLTTPEGLFAARSFPIHAGDTVLASAAPLAAAQSILGLINSVLRIDARLGA